MHTVQLRSPAFMCDINRILTATRRLNAPMARRRGNRLCSRNTHTHTHTQEREEREDRQKTAVDCLEIYSRRLLMFGRLLLCRYGFARPLVLPVNKCLLQSLRLQCSHFSLVSSSWSEAALPKVPSMCCCKICLSKREKIHQLQKHLKTL